MRTPIPAQSKTEPNLSRRSFLMAGIGCAALAVIDRACGGTPASAPPPTLLNGHEGRVCSLAFSPNGHVLASGSEDTTAILWDLKRKTASHILRGHRQRILRVVFSADGNSLLTHAFNDGARVWDVLTGALKLSLPDNYHNGSVIRFAHDGRLVVQGGQQLEVRASGQVLIATLNFWDVQTGKLRRSVTVGENLSIDTLSISPDGRMFALGNILLDSMTGKWLRIMKPSPRSTVFSPNGKWLAGAVDSPSNSAPASLLLEPLGHLSPATETLAGEVCVWSPEIAEPKSRLKGHVGTVYGLDFSPDSSTLITRSLLQRTLPGSDLGQQLTDVRVWDLHTGKLRWALDRDPCGAFAAPAFSPDCRTVALGKLYEVQTGRQRTALEPGVPAAFSPNGKIVASARNPANAISFWPLDN